MRQRQGESREPDRRGLLKAEDCSNFHHHHIWKQRCAHMAEGFPLQYLLQHRDPWSFCSTLQSPREKVTWRTPKGTTQCHKAHPSAMTQTENIYHCQCPHHVVTDMKNPDTRLVSWSMLWATFPAGVMGQAGFSRGTGWFRPAEIRSSTNLTRLLDKKKRNTACRFWPSGTRRMLKTRMSSAIKILSPCPPPPAPTLFQHTDTYTQTLFLTTLWHTSRTL